MSFIAVTARADVSGTKKGKLTPAQYAQLNAFCLTKKTGILDFGNKCESTNEYYSVTDNAATVIFKSGFVVICGRLVECEQNTSVIVSAPLTGTTYGKIILRYNLSAQGANEFVVTTTTSALVQDDLNNNPISGIYEFELYSYVATPTIVTLTRNDTNYVSTVEKALNDYDETKGTIEERLGALTTADENTNTAINTINGRLDNLGFKQAIISSYDAHHISSLFGYQQGKIIALQVGIKTDGSGQDGVVATITNIDAPTQDIPLAIRYLSGSGYQSRGKSYVWKTNNTIVVNTSYLSGGLTSDANVVCVINQNEEHPSILHW